MPVLPNQAGAERFERFFVRAVFYFADAALNLQLLLKALAHNHPVGPAHRIVTESFDLNGKHHFCACPLAISRQ